MTTLHYWNDEPALLHRLEGMNVRRTHGIALLLLLVLVAELIISVRRQSLSWDEGDHIFAGYQSWKAADFGVNPEHPPLVKALATLPLLAMHLRTPAPKGLAFFKDEAYFDGRDLIYDNGGLATANRIIFRARMFAAVLSLLMALLVYLAALEMFSPMAGLFALTLIVFEPNLIAHGAYVTTDMGITCFMFATVFALFRFRERPSWKTLPLLGLATGLALASKHSAVLLLPIALALGVCEVIAPGSGERRVETRKDIARQYAIAFAGAASIGLIILWATYGFRFSAHPNGVSMTPSLAEYIRPLHGIEPKIYLLLAHMRILPESYLYGLADIRLLSVAGQSFPTYLFHRVHAHGVPYYFPAAFVVKSTLGFMLLLVFAGYAVLSERLEGRRKLTFLMVPPIVYLIIAMFTGLNIGARHILPMYPFLAVLIGGAAVALARTRRVWMVAVSALLAWHVVSSIRSAPVYLAYANEAWGGPSQTYRYLTDSNVDWGQQLMSVKEYVDRNGIKDCWFGYFVQPYIDYHAYGIPCRPLPTADSIWAHAQIDTPPSISGVVFISASTVTGYEFGSALDSPYQTFLQLKPVAIIDRGVYVYNGTFDTRFASALGHATRATALFDRKDFAGALTEAQTAVATDPEVLPAQSILGDTLAALHRDRESAAAYDKALAIAARMEPDAKADRQKVLTAKKQALHL
jgi:Dolichyl-phosphate-mannose-protein mannosyltransferase